MMTDSSNSLCKDYGLKLPKESILSPPGEPLELDMPDSETKEVSRDSEGLICDLILTSLPLTDDVKVAKSKSMKRHEGSSLEKEINHQYENGTEMKPLRKNRKLPETPRRTKNEENKIDINMVNNALIRRENRNSAPESANLSSDINAISGVILQLEVVDVSERKAQHLKDEGCQTDIKGSAIDSIAYMNYGGYSNNIVTVSPRSSPRRMTSSELHRTPDQMVKQADRLIQRTQDMLARSAEVKRKTEELLKQSRERRAEEQHEDWSSINHFKDKLEEKG